MEEELKQNTQQPKDGQSASPKHMSIRSILGGDILANDFFKRQTRLLILIMILTVLYIDNRYSSQQELIEIDKLKKDLIDIKYDALTRSSELMEKSRQSRIEEYISAQKRCRASDNKCHLPPFHISRDFFPSANQTWNVRSLVSLTLQKPKPASDNQALSTYIPFPAAAIS